MPSVIKLPNQTIIPAENIDFYFPRNISIDLHEGTVSVSIIRGF